MGLIVPNSIELLVAQYILKTNNFILKLYSNNYEPDESSTAANFTEVVGGGYSEKYLPATSWILTLGDPTTGVQFPQVFTFSSATNAPGTIFGYYIVDPNGIYIWGERFIAPFDPFTPLNGSTIRITPRFEVS